jgi:hypothetical protein
LTRQTVVEVFRNHRNPARARWRAVCGACAVVCWSAAAVTAAHGHLETVVLTLLFAVAPDGPLFYGMGPDFVAGRLETRAVRAYNATHSFAGPVLMACGSAALGSVTFSAAGLAWFAHTLTDRALGYGLRARDGWQHGYRPSRARYQGAVPDRRAAAPRREEIR